MQMDEAAFPILLVDMLRRHSPFVLGDLQRWWALVSRAAGYIIRNGPVTQQDRWEEDAGYSPFTLAVEISGLLAAADLADAVGQKADIATHLRETADCWNDNIERWVYAEGQRSGAATRRRRLLCANRAAGLGLRSFAAGRICPHQESASGTRANCAAVHLISPDSLALVRFGLRAPDDPRILNTVKVIDALLKVNLPQGPCWYRYNGDGYGEHEDGSPFDGTGIGRPWPLLAGERAHYELAAGRPQAAEELLKVMELSTEGGRLIPEQVWDADDIPALELFRGKPTGSACPLVWAHSEYIKLRRSLRDGKIFDQPPQTVQRYQVEKQKAAYFEWRFNNKCRTMPQGKKLRMLLPAPATVHWSFDGWQTAQDTNTRDPLGVYVADLPTDALAKGREIVFTFYWPQEQRWEGVNYTIVVVVRHERSYPELVRFATFAIPFALLCSQGFAQTRVRNERNKGIRQSVAKNLLAPTARNIRIQRAGANRGRRQQPNALPERPQQHVPQPKQRHVNHEAAQHPRKQILPQIAGLGHFGRQARNRLPSRDLRPNAAVKLQQHFLVAPLWSHK